MIPVIFIDTKKVRELDIGIALRKLYYQASGYQRTAQNLFKASLKAGYDFTLSEIKEWLEKQALYQIHKPRPKYIPCASFNKITVPMEVIQADLCYMPHDQVGNKIYKYALNCVDIASRTKWTYPLTDRDSASVAKGFLKLYKFHNFPLTQLKILQTDYGSEFYGKCEELMIKYNIEISRSKSKKRQGIVERYNRTLQEWSFYIQDGVELLLPPMECCRAWVNDLPIFLEKIDNTKTRLIGMSPAEARKLKHVYAKSSKPRYGPMGFDEIRLSYNDPVRYLLEPGELEGGRKRATDFNWSPQIYHIKESLVQKNQPVLYWIEDIDGNGPKRSFVREELMVVKNVEYPPQRILKS
ncbi:5253_t:CDS:1 [Entrophospora sp. SA101]|nr:5253_t:CDS:1 [Entrophospora sp. SA101]